MVTLDLLGTFSNLAVWLVRAFGLLFGVLVWTVLSLNCISDSAYKSAQKTIRRAFLLYWYTFLLVFVEALAGAILRGWFGRGSPIGGSVDGFAFILKYSCKLTFCLILASAFIIVVGRTLELRERQSDLRKKGG